MSESKPVEPRRVRKLMDVLFGKLLGFDNHALESSYVDRVGRIDQGDAEEVWLRLGYPNQSFANVSPEALFQSIIDARKATGMNDEAAWANAARTKHGAELIDAIRNPREKPTPRQMADEVRNREPVYYASNRKLLSWVLDRLGVKKEQIDATIADTPGQIEISEIQSLVETTKRNASPSAANTVQNPAGAFDLLVHLQMEITKNEWHAAYVAASHSIYGRELIAAMREGKSSGPLTLSPAAIANRDFLHLVRDQMRAQSCNYQSAWEAVRLTSKGSRLCAQWQGC